MRIVTATAAVMSAVTAFAAAPANAGDLADLKAARAKLETAFVDQDAAAIRSLMTSDHVAATYAYGGVLDLDAQIASIGDLKVAFSDVSAPMITLFDAEGAYVTYETSLDGTYRGKPLPHRVFVSEIWVKTDGRWLEKAYQETVIDSP